MLKDQQPQVPNFEPSAESSIQIPQSTQPQFHIDELQIITGIDIAVDELKLVFHQPKVAEIARIGEQNYFLALSITHMSPKQLGIKTPEVTSWQIFQESINQQLPGVKSTRILIQNFLQLFITERVNLGPRSIMIDQGELGILNIENDNFDLFQEVICLLGGYSLLSPAEEQFNPKNKRAAEIAEKMKAARARIAKQKPQSTGDGFIAKYVRAVVTRTANSLEDVGKMTLLQLNSILKTYLNWEEYDLDVRSRLAGAKNDNPLEHWLIKEIDKEESDIGTL